MILKSVISSQCKYISRVGTCIYSGLHNKEINSEAAFFASIQFYLKCMGKHYSCLTFMCKHAFGSKYSLMEPSAWLWTPPLFCYNFYAFLLVATMAPVVEWVGLCSEGWWFNPHPCQLCHGRCVLGQDT